MVFRGQIVAPGGYTVAVRRRRSIYGGDGSYTERLLREVTAKKF